MSSIEMELGREGGLKNKALHLNQVYENKMSRGVNSLLADILVPFKGNTFSINKTIFLYDCREGLLFLSQ